MKQKHRFINMKSTQMERSPSRSRSLLPVSTSTLAMVGMRHMRSRNRSRSRSRSRPPVPVRDVRVHVRDRLKKTSKHLMSVLRYHHEDVQRDSNGWAPLEQVLRAMGYRYSVVDIMRVIGQSLYRDGKPRFESRGLYVRACENRVMSREASRGHARWL